MADLIEQFLVYKQINRNRSARTVQVYRMALGRLALFLGDRSAVSATHDDLVAFSGAWLHKTYKLGPKARSQHVSAVRELYAWLKKGGAIESNPAAALEHPQIGRTLPRVMTLASAEKIMWAPDFETFKGVRDAAVLAMLLGCGLRVSGLVALNESNLRRDVIDDKPRIVVQVTEKRGRERQMPLPADAALLLQIYMEHPDLKAIDRALPNGDKVLFVSLVNQSVPPHEYIGEKRRLRRRAVLKMVRHYGRAQGLPEDQIHPHAMRHLFGTELAESEVDLLQRQKAMGHADPKSTEIYTHLAMRKMTRDLDRANPLAKIKTPVSDLLKRLSKGGDGA
jgi:integrase/recombinase XerD